MKLPQDHFRINTLEKKGIKPTKQAKESSPGPSRGLNPCNALGSSISNISSRVGVGCSHTPTRDEALDKYRSSTQGDAAGSRLRLLLFGRFALGYSPMAFQAIFIED